MSIQRIDHIEVWAKDLDESVEFYTRILGFTETRRTEARRSDGTVHSQSCVVLGDFMVELIDAPQERKQEIVDPGSPGVKSFALRVDDMEETVAMLIANGVKMAQLPRQGSSFAGLRAEFYDPNGIGIELRQWLEGDTFNNANWQPVRQDVTRTA